MRLLGALAGLIALSACGSSTAPSAAGGVATIALAAPDAPSTSPPPGVRMPVPALTPGVVDTRLTAEVICAAGFRTAPYRTVTYDEKRQVYAEYGVAFPQPSGSVEVDHLIPLEAGGSSDIGNLWVEPASPAPGFHEKDQLENAVRDEVCRRHADLATLQRRIAQNWYALYVDLCLTRQVCHP